MSPARETLLRLLVDPARFEEIVGDLEESRPTRTALDQLRDVASVCFRQSRLRTVPGSLAVPLVTALGALILLAQPVPVFTVRAHDDAGTFSVQFVGREVVGAIIGGEVVRRDQLTREGDFVIIRSGTATDELRLRILGEARFEWTNRSAPGLNRR